jgi:hypothetical protein
MLHVPPVVRVPQFENRWNRLSLMIILVEAPELIYPKQCGPPLSSKLDSPDLNHKLIEILYLIITTIEILS